MKFTQSFIQPLHCTYVRISRLPGFRKLQERTFASSTHPPPSETTSETRCLQPKVIASPTLASPATMHKGSGVLAMVVMRRRVVVGLFNVHPSLLSWLYTCGRRSGLLSCMHHVDNPRRHLVQQACQWASKRRTSP